MGVSTIGPNDDAAGERDYTSITAWLAAENRSAADMEGQIDEDATFSENVSIATAASGTNRVILTVNADYRHSGYWGSGAQIAGKVALAADYITCEWFLQKPGDRGFEINGKDYCAIRNIVQWSTVNKRAVYAYGIPDYFEIHSCAFFNTYGSGNSVTGIDIASADHCYVTHCSVRGWNNGIISTYGSGTTRYIGRNACLGNYTEDLTLGGTGLTAEYNLSLIHI